ncbi:aldehyde dehydrogenase family protein [Nocardioides bigeumensis]|uniref:aldehyde dehydrogenase (NAD(+)) n=1 Tax=Nocardioides bigeumensis TaxID=433657 RepID=A0ABN2YZY2_9ACTN
MGARRRARGRTTRDRIYIGGAWVASAGAEVIDVVDPTVGLVMGSVPAGAQADVDAAVAAARATFSEWSQVPAAERAAYLSAIADGLERRTDELAELIALEVGMPEHQCVDEQIPVEDFRVHAELATTYPFEEQTDAGVVLREPVGVVAAITPWNYPLSQIAAKVAPALATGCTVVVKPSEVAPLNAFILAEVVHEAGLPPGVFNLVSGDGETVGEPLVSHADVDMVSFTGSTRAGRRIAEIAAGRIARVTLELGGKSPLVILDDADLDEAVAYGVRDCFTNSGQTCNALTRMLVPRERSAEAAHLAGAVADLLVVGDPLAPGTDLGPLVSEVQRDRVRDHLDRALKNGARLVAGGLDVPKGTPDGFFVRPTVLADVTNDQPIAREEVFGPVLVVIAYDDEDDAVRIANDSDYGLWAGVWSGSEERARRVARRLRVGGVSVNGAEGTAQTPFGGYKQSGIGREMGPLGMDEYVEVKALIG